MALAGESSGVLDAAEKWTFALRRIWIVTETDLNEFIAARRRELKRRYQGYFEEEFPPEPDPSGQMRTRTVRVYGGQKPG
jgi:hypothetical protein